MRLSPTEPGAMGIPVQQSSTAGLHTQVVAAKHPVCTAPAYTMSRGLTRVLEFWREWHNGIGAEPSIESLEKTFGTKWRSSAREFKFYSRRNVIIQHVKATMSARNIGATAALVLNEREQGMKNLDAFSKFLSQLKYA